LLDASTKPRAGSPVSKADRTMAGPGRGPGNARVDHLLVAEMIERDARVLDVGCGDGALLKLLESRGVEGRGIELSREGVNDCVAKGLAVIQGDADADLADYPTDAFDYVILSQTLQATRRPRQVLQHMLRIGRHAVVSFPNFGHWRIRLRLLFGGRMPRTDNLPDTWYDTPNIHFCTIKDFRDLCEIAGVRMERAVALDAWGRPLRLNAPWWFWNLFGEQAVFLLGRGRGSGAVPAGSSAVNGERLDRAF
jgi:methionine biosynthesis protein MetW